LEYDEDEWVSDNVNNISIGYEDINSGYPDFFQGKIDNVGIWNIALTPAQVQEVYNAQ
jgi:hypothetical protein